MTPGLFYVRVFLTRMQLQILGPLLTPPHPFLQPPQVPRPESTLKRLRISGQTRRYRITLQRIQNRLILLILWRIDMES